MDKNRLGIKATSTQEIIMRLVACYQDIQQNKENSPYFKSYSNLNLLNDMIEHANNQNPPSQQTSTINTELILTNFSTLKQQVENMDETCQELQYQNKVLQKQIETQQQLIEDQKTSKRTEKTM